MWIWVEDLIDRAVDSSQGELDADRLRTEARDGNLALWVATDPNDFRNPLAVAVTRLEDWSGESVLRIVCLAGVERKRWLHLIERLEDLARFNGVSRVMWEGRKGWARLLPDYQVERIVLGKRL